MGHHGRCREEVPCPANEGPLGALFCNQGNVWLLVLALLFLFCFCRGGDENDEHPKPPGFPATELIEQLNRPTTRS